MKEVLELKHLAPYLPYGLKIIWEDSGEINGINFDGEIDFQNSTYPLSTLVFTFRYPENMGWKPILLPLSDLTKEIEHNRERFVPIDIICPKEDYKKEFDRKVAIGSIELQGAINFSCTPFCIVQKLFEWHFDVFGLIDKGLAVDIIHSTNQYKSWN